MLAKPHKETFNLNPLSSVAMQAFCSHLKSVIYGHQPLLLQKQGCASQMRATITTLCASLGPDAELQIPLSFLAFWF